MLSTGILLGIAAAFFWGCADFFAKIAVTREKKFIPIHISNFVALLVIIGYNLLNPTPGYSLFTIVPSVILVSISMTGGWWFFWKSLQSGKLTLQTAVGASYGFITLILAVLFLGEKPTFLQVLGAFAIVCGVFLLSGFRSLKKAKFDMNIFMAFLAALSWGSSYFFLAPILKVHPIGVVLMSHMFFSQFVSFGIVILTGNRLLPRDLNNLKPVMAAGLVDSLGIICYYVAAGTILISLLAPISSMYPVFTAFLAFIFMNERLTKEQLAFVGMIIIGILLISL
ncbi:MAG: EamA family transporter [Candidatus Micrarchaeota archaeon]